MAKPSRSNCKFCKGKIRWGRSSSDPKKMIPLDPIPTTTGTFGLVLQGDGAPPLVVAAQDHHQLRYDRHRCPKS